jgi:hypothetical protein
MHDTTPEASTIHLAAVRAMEPAARLRLALDASELSRRLLLTGLRARYPESTDLQLVELSLGHDLVPAGSRPSIR